MVNWQCIGCAQLLLAVAVALVVDRSSDRSVAQQRGGSTGPRALVLSVYMPCHAVS